MKGKLSWSLAKYFFSICSRPLLNQFREWIVISRIIQSSSLKTVFHQKITFPRETFVVMKFTYNTFHKIKTISGGVTPGIIMIAYEVNASTVFHPFTFNRFPVQRDTSYCALSTISFGNIMEFWIFTSHILYEFCIVFSLNWAKKPFRLIYITFEICKGVNYLLFP